MAVPAALAHPFFAVAAPLGPRHRSRLAELFPVWEVRNGSRARELNMPAAVYIETHGGTGIGGSDDHAGVDIGRTWTETPPASTPEEFLRHVREGRAEAPRRAGKRRQVGPLGAGAGGQGAGRLARTSPDTSPATRPGVTGRVVADAGADRPGRR